MAAQWAADRAHPEALADHQYEQTHWSCGTSCCVHGAAHILARGSDTDEGPTDHDYTDLPEPYRTLVIGILRSTRGRPAQVIDLIDRARRGASLAGVDLARAALTGAYLAGAIGI